MLVVCVCIINPLYCTNSMNDAGPASIARTVHLLDRRRAPAMLRKSRCILGYEKKFSSLKLFE